MTHFLSNGFWGALFYYGKIADDLKCKIICLLLRVILDRSSKTLYNCK